MIPFRKIMFPVDYSAPCEAVVPYLKEVVHRFSTDLTLVHYSIGKWESDALVVDTIGIHQETWLDNAGHPHSGDLHLTERFRRWDVGHLDIEVTIDDPKTHAKPTIVERATLVPDTELLEYVCIDSDYKHLVR